MDAKELKRYNHICDKLRNNTRLDGSEIGFLLLYAPNIAEQGFQVEPDIAVMSTIIDISVSNELYVIDWVRFYDKVDCKVQPRRVYRIDENIYYKENDACDFEES